MTIDRSIPSPARAAAGAAALAAALALAACGSGSDGDDVAVGADATPGTGVEADRESEPVVDTSGGTPPGTADDAAPTSADVARYGVVAVGDENGIASGDALASFSRLSTSVATGAFGPALDATAAVCSTAMDDGRPNLMLATALYLPLPDGARLTSIGAGDAVLLSGGGTSWLELQGQPSDRFYTRPAGTAAPTGAVPEPLVANVTGDEFPAFADVAFPTVTPLDAVDLSGGEGITVDTRFTWEPGDDPGARVRIETTSVASFFADDGLSVTCLAPDTGEFAFPAETRAALGTEFVGDTPDFSRLAFASLREGDALLVLVRESFLR